MLLFSSFASAAVCMLIASFLLGSIPWGLIISKEIYNVDVRKVGSGNIGTTNVIRACGKPAGFFVFALDMLKGLLLGLAALAVTWPGAGAMVGDPVMSTATLLGISFFGTTFGHMFSPWLRFKGGKGIACSIGALFAVFGPLWAFIELAVFVIIVVSTKYVSAGSLASSVACPFIAAYLFLFKTFAPVAFVLCTIVSIVVVWAHRQNIMRLRAGTEHRIGHRSSQRKMNAEEDGVSDSSEQPKFEDEQVVEGEAPKPEGEQVVEEDLNEQECDSDVQHKEEGMA